MGLEFHACTRKVVRVLRLQVDKGQVFQVCMGLVFSVGMAME